MSCEHQGMAAGFPQGEGSETERERASKTAVPFRTSSGKGHTIVSAMSYGEHLSPLVHLWGLPRDVRIFGGSSWVLTTSFLVKNKWDHVPALLKALSSGLSRVRIPTPRGEFPVDTTGSAPAVFPPPRLASSL